MAKKLLTSIQLSERLGISDVTARLWRMQGKGPQFIKIGHFVRYDEAEVERWLAERTRISTSQRAPASDLAATA